MKKNTEEKMVQKRRVVITGLGAVTPIGNTVPEFWTNVRKGTVGIGEITGFDTKDFKVKLAAQVKDFHGEEKMDAKAARRMELFSQYAVAAAKEAMSKLPDHAPVNDIQTVLDEMNKLSLSPVCYKQTHPIKDQKFSFSIE